MILHRLLASHPSLSTTDKFAFVVLKRLSITEAATALGLAYEPPYATDLTPVQRTVLGAVGRLSRLIANAYESTLKKQPSKSAIKKQAMESARSILSSFKNDHDVSDKIKDFLGERNKRILENLKKHPPINELATIETLLVTAFPQIDKIQLKAILHEMNQAILSLNPDAESQVKLNAVVEPSDSSNILLPSMESSSQNLEDEALGQQSHQAIEKEELDGNDGDYVKINIDGLLQHTVFSKAASSPGSPSRAVAKGRIMNVDSQQEDEKQQCVIC